MLIIYSLLSHKSFKIPGGIAEPYGSFPCHDHPPAEDNLLDQTEKEIDSEKDSLRIGSRWRSLRRVRRYLCPIVVVQRDALWHR